MGQKRVLQGIVVSDKMDKSVVVSVEHRKRHRLYHKVMTLSKKFMAHDEMNECTLGDVVRLEEFRPLSKRKRWRVIEILNRGDVADISPETIGRKLEESTQMSAKSEAAAEAATEVEDEPETAEVEG